MTGYIDIHQHAIPPRYRAALESVGLTEPDGFPLPAAWDVQTTLELMGKLRIDAAVLSISTPGVHLGGGVDTVALAQHVNDDMSQICIDDPSRFGFVASLPLPGVDAALAEIERASHLFGCDGYSLLTHVDGVYLGDDKLEPLMRELNDRKAIAMMHPTTPAEFEVTALNRPRPMMEFLFDTTRAVSNLLLNGVFQRYPDITWIIPHTGSAIPSLAARWQLFTFGAVPTREPNLDIIAELKRQWWDTAGAALPYSLPALIQLVGTEHLVYGSDYPFTPSFGVELLTAAVDEYPIVEGTSTRELLGGNAAALFPRLASLIETPM